MLLLTIMAGCTPDLSGPTQEEQKPPSQAEKDAYAKWETEVQNIHKQADEAMDLYTEISGAVKEGTKDIDAAYNEISEVKDTVTDAWSKLGQVTCDDVLSDDHEARLTAALEDLKQGLISKAESLEIYLEYLEDQNPDTLNEVRAKLSAADGFMFNGMVKYTDVKGELGLTTVQ